jgi:hypothetical protein
VVVDAGFAAGADFPSDDEVFPSEDDVEDDEDESDEDDEFPLEAAGADDEPDPLRLSVR